MGWFSNLTRWVVDDVLGIDLPDPKANDSAAAAAASQAAATQQALNEQTTALREQTAIARQSADASLAAQKKALQVSEAALLPNTDSESAVVAGENRQRRLKSSSPWGIGLQKKLGAAPVGFRVLSGQ